MRPAAELRMVDTGGGTVMDVAPLQSWPGAQNTVGAKRTTVQLLDFPSLLSAEPVFPRTSPLLSAPDNGPASHLP